MKNFVFLGDSITDAGRLWLPEYNGLGNGYVKILSEKLSDKFSVINKGHGSFTLPFLLRNLTTDCLSLSPAAVSILIGINDVGVAKNTGKSLRAQEFASNYDTLIRRLLEASIPSVFLMSPFLFSRPQEYLNWLPELREAEHTHRNSRPPVSAPLPAPPGPDAGSRKIRYRRPHSRRNPSHGFRA